MTSFGNAIVRCTLLGALLCGLIVPLTANEDAEALREQLNRAETLIEQARSYLRDGQYADANAAARLANSIVQSLPSDTAFRLRALRVDPERHTRRDPPAFTAVPQARVPAPPGARGAASRTTDILTVEVTPTVIRSYDAQRNPWNGDQIYLYNETAARGSSTGAHLIAAIDVLRPVSGAPFDIRAMEIRIGNERYRFGFPDDTVARTRDSRWYLESVRIPVDEQLHREIERALSAPTITITLEGNEERVPLVFGRSERDAVRRMLNWAADSPESD